MLVRFFVDRPVFATVLSIVIVIIGSVALVGLPIAQYPEVTPPTVSITTSYPGANAQVVADTVAAPLEQEVNGVEGMLYMLSRCTNDGMMTLDVTFELGTDIDFAQVLTQNRVSIANAKLPEEVKRQGVVVKKKSSSILLCINLISPNNRYNDLYLSNYSTIYIRDAISRLDGVGDVAMLGAADYSMRVWLDPAKLASRNMTANDVIQSLREQNAQVAAGSIGAPPVPQGLDFQLTINTQGRLTDVGQFSDIIIKTGADGQPVRIRDVGRTELGSKTYGVSSFLDGQPSATIAVYQLPGSNALETAEMVKAEMERLKELFPQGIEYKIVYDTTVFIDESVHEVYKTLFEAFILVFLVVLLFLQDWKATLLPMIDVPVSLIGTFGVMALLGFSLNNLSLFGLVLAIGIVVDDAIMVVENIERWMAKGYESRAATIHAMDEITGPVMAVTLVLCSVFIPTAFIAGISGQFYRQFALTIAASTVISAINALTMAPPRAVQIFGAGHSAGGGHDEHKEALPRVGTSILFGVVALLFFGHFLTGLLEKVCDGVESQEVVFLKFLIPGGISLHLVFQVLIFVAGFVLGRVLSKAVNKVLNVFFRGFNWVFERVTNFYGGIVSRCLRLSAVVLLVYGGLMFLTYLGFAKVPMGFIPNQDKGYLIVNAQLPDGASSERTQAVMQQVTEIVRSTTGVGHTIGVPGYSILTGVNLPNAGGMFVVLKPFEHRVGDEEQSAPHIANVLRQKLSKIQEAQVVVFGAPPVDGLGSTAGFKMQIQDRAGVGPEQLQATVANMAEAGNAQPGLAGLFSSYRANQPQLFVEINRAKAKSQGVSLDEINSALQVYLGSGYANDFTLFGRNWQVNVQADSQYRIHPEDIGKLKVRNSIGQMVPLATLIEVKEVTGPAVVYRYKMFPSAELSGGTKPGVSSGQAVSIMEELAKNELPIGMSFEWTELTLQQILAGNTAVFVFILGTVFVFLVLCAQYESWTMPIAIILIVPMCLLSAIAGVWLAKMDNNIFTQIGLVVLIALAAKNAILIVEFAKQLQNEGKGRVEAAVEACKVRFRPILMTSAAFICGVVPLMLGEGAGAEMRNTLGVTVFSGMLGVTIFGIFFTPVFYSVVVYFFEGDKPHAAEMPPLTNITPQEPVPPVDQTPAIPPTVSAEKPKPEANNPETKPEPEKPKE